MRLLELNILEFGGLRDQKISLGEGLNLFEGENESGKSTVWLFIKFMLYGMPRRGQEERERSVSRDTHCAKGSMTVSADGEEYRIERAFTEGARSGSDRVHCYRLRDGAEVFSGEEPGQALLKVGREIFESTCGVGQMQCRSMGGKKGMDAIRNLLSSADEETDISRVEARLDQVRKIYRLKKGDGGRLYELNRDFNSLRARHADALEAQRRMAELTEQLERGESQAKQRREELERIDELLPQLGRREILRRFDELRNRKNEWESIRRERKQLASDAQIPEPCPTEADALALQRFAQTCHQARQRTLHAEERRCSLERMLQQDEALAEHARQAEADGGADAVRQRASLFKKRKRSGRLLLWSGAVSASAVVLASLLIFPLVCVFAVIPLAWAAWGALRIRGAMKNERKLWDAYGQSAETLEAYLRRCGEYLEKLVELDEQSRIARAEESSAREWENAAQEQMEALLKRIAPNASPTAEGAQAEAEKLLQYWERERILSMRMELLSQAIAAEADSLAAYRENELRASISEEIERMSDQDVSELQRRKKFLSSAYQALSNDIANKKIELASLGASVSSPMALADRMSLLQNEIQRAEEYYSALELAIECLAEASQAMSGSVTPALSRSAGALMAAVSDGAYTELMAGNALTPVLTGSDGLTLPTELMSGGTADAAYLALRIALMEQVFGQELPPLMLDDALCQMDDKRMRRMLKIFHGQCERGLQCLLFTCHRREAEACKEMAIPFQKIVM